MSEVIREFEIEQMGRGPERIRIIIFRDIIIIRLNGFLSPYEKSLAKTNDVI
jgi:uncharacterized protein YbcI